MRQATHSADVLQEQHRRSSIYGKMYSLEPTKSHSTTGEHVGNIYTASVPQPSEATNWDFDVSTSTTSQDGDGATDENFRCSFNVTVPFSDPCTGLSIQVGYGSGFFVASIGIAFNLVSFMSFNKMSLNKESLFLMKSLAVYDTLFLSTWIFLTFPRFMGWVIGTRDVQYTVYYYFYQVVYCVYRTALSVAFWMVCLLTGHR